MIVARYEDADVALTEALESGPVVMREGQCAFIYAGRTLWCDHWMLDVTSPA